MYYKIKLTNDGIEILSKQEIKGKDKKNILYVSEEELNMFNSKIVLDTTDSKRLA